MFSNIGIPGLILILVIALVIFGPSKLPQVGRALGQTLQEFRNSARDLSADLNTEDDQEEKKKRELKSVEPIRQISNS